jgi:hypothetical protein
MAISNPENDAALPLCFIQVDWCRVGVHPFRMAWRLGLSLSSVMKPKQVVYLISLHAPSIMTLQAFVSHVKRQISLPVNISIVI